jgi:hypothetical protein
MSLKHIAYDWSGTFPSSATLLILEREFVTALYGCTGRCTVVQALDELRFMIMNYYSIRPRCQERDHCDGSSDHRPAVTALEMMIDRKFGRR